MSDFPSRLPDSPSLEQLRKQAKTLLRAYREGDEAAARRFRALAPRAASGAAVLADAQFVIAREHGFASWPAFLRRSDGDRPHGLERYAEAAAPHARGAQATPGTRPASPVYTIDSEEGTLELKAPLTERDWEAVFEVIREEQITALHAGGQMTDALAARLDELRHLIRLDLSGSRGLTDAGARHLAKLPALIEVNLGGSGVTDRGLEVFRELPELRTVKLAHHPAVSDRGVANLRTCERLEFVDLMGTPTGDGAIDTLAGKRDIRRFYAGNQVTDSGLRRLHDVPAFKAWRGGVIHFALDAFDAFPTYVFLNMKTPFSDAGLSNLAGLEGLFAVNCFATTGFHAFDDSRSQVTAAGVASLNRLSHLGWLGCCARLGGDATMREVAAMPHVRMLFGQDMVAGDEGFAALSASRTIEYINGRRTYNLGSRGLRSLAAMPALRGLSMSCRHVGDDGFAALPDFPAFTECGLSDVPDDSYGHVGRCRRLEWIRFSRENTDAATAHIQGLNTLKRVEMNGTHVTDRSLEVLAAMPSLEAIGLHGCRGVTSAGLALLADLPRLRELQLNLPRLTRDELPTFPSRVRIRYHLS